MDDLRIMFPRPTTNVNKGNRKNKGNLPINERKETRCYRASNDEFVKLEQAADRLHMSTSELTRWLVFFGAIEILNRSEEDGYKAPDKIDPELEGYE